MITQLTTMLVLVFTGTHAVDYCKIRTCDRGAHTMCLYKLSSSCPELIKTGLTSDEKKKILDTHNQLRQRVASGQETRGNPGPQPAAKLMTNLEWDDELAEIAQRWASQCNMNHDKCRDTDQFRVGQNIGWLGNNITVNINKVESIIQLWYDEVEDFNRYDVLKFRKIEGMTVGHYTQLVWGSTTKLGCGAAKYKQGEFYLLHLVCNYGPSGNRIDDAVYST